MAIVSFRVRRADSIGSPDANPFGSYVRGTDTTAPVGYVKYDADSALRADGFIVPVAGLDVDATFSAIATSHAKVRLEWSRFALSELNDIAVGETKIQGIVVVYSATGSPETIADGKIVKRQVAGDITYAYDHIGLEKGRWAYYSLFLHWNQNGAGASGINWYERVATLQELVPFQYHSTRQLWEKLPAYHRLSDEYGTQTDPEDLGHGYLYRFLSVFGFELDKTRTLIDSVISQYNPSLAETNSIYYLSKMLGLEVGIEDLGTSKIRQIVHDIGYYRRRKGTIVAAKDYITALSGCQVDVIENMSSPRFEFRVHAEKANLIGDSLFVITSPTKTWEVYGETASVSYSKVNDTLVVTNTGSASVQFALKSKVGVPVDETVDYWMSIAMTASAGQVWGAQWDSTSTGWTNWSTSNQASQIMPANLSPDGRTVILMPDTVSSSASYPVMLFGLGAGASMAVTEWMVEPRTFSPFFNGSSDFGGFVYQSTFSDHQWSGSQYASYSTYTTNRKKTQDAIDRVLPKLLPVTMLINTSIGYQIYYDWIPGKT